MTHQHAKMARVLSFRDLTRSLSEAVSRAISETESVGLAQVSI